MTTDCGIHQPAHQSPPIGPFVMAVMSTVLATALLAGFGLGWRLSMITALAILIPGMTFSTLFIAISMGWIFLAIGRSHRKPRWVAGTAVFITVTMLELLILTYIAGLSDT